VIHGFFAALSALAGLRGVPLRDPLKPSPPRRPGNDVALVIRDRDDGVVKRRMNMHHASAMFFAPVFSARALARFLVVFFSFLFRRGVAIISSYYLTFRGCRFFARDVLPALTGARIRMVRCRAPANFYDDAGHDRPHIKWRLIFA